MTIETHREAIKVRIDHIDDENQLRRIEALLRETGDDRAEITHLPDGREITEADTPRWSVAVEDVVVNGNDTPQAEMERHYGLR